MKGLNTLVNPIKISEGAELAVARHERMLFTEPFSVLGEVAWGSTIPWLMYEPATLGNAREALREVQDILSKDEEIIIESIEVRFIPTDIKGRENMLMEINYSFRMKAEPTEKINVRFFRIAEL